MLVILMMVVERAYKHTVGTVLLSVGDDFDDRVKVGAFCTVSWVAIASLEWPVAVVVSAGLVLPLWLAGFMARRNGR